MKQVTYTDTKGVRKVVLLRDGDPDEAAPRIGIPVEPPDLNDIDWGAVKSTLKEQLTARGLMTWEDIQYNEGSFIGALLAALKPPVVTLYRAKARLTR